MFVEEQTILSGGVEELTKLREELINQASIRSEIEHLIVESGKLEKQIEAEEKLIKNTIEATVNKRRNEVTKSFDSEIQKEKNKLNDIKSKKNKVKKKGVRDRIDKETLSLKEANRTLHSEIRTALGHSGVPTYCDSSWFYTLYMPSGMKEILILMALFFGVVIVFPWIMIALADKHWLLDTLFLLLYEFVVCAVYVTIYLFTKDKDKDVLIDMRQKRDEIKINEKEIRRIKRDIKNDTDESMYNLSEYDEQIKKSEETISQIVVQKNDALKDFEENTKQAIIDEITGRDKEKIEGLKSALLNATEAKKEAEQKQQEVTLGITSKYEAFIGNDMMDVNKVDEMIKLINEGQVATVAEAVNKIRATIA